VVVGLAKAWWGAARTAPPPRRPDAPPAPDAPDGSGQLAPRL